MKYVKSISLLLSLFVLGFLYIQNTFVYTADEHNVLWKIRSIDTMKTSRDKAREKLYRPEYDENIKQELTAIKKAGANYVAVDTPYDNEFLPYLRRWVKLARKTRLHVWFRGNWSAWEGWFDYPKNMTPDQHLAKTSEFILTYSDLFEDEDIFDSCPECENAGHWRQPDYNKEYNTFLQKQRLSNQKTFEKIGKKVHSNIASIIGGRAREVLDQKTFDALDNTVAIDHYIHNPSNMGDYITYFYDKHRTKVLVSELGAPIPDINGEMSEEEQAQFISQLFEQLYKHKDAVEGANYYVLTLGTTALLNADYTPRKAYSIVKNYFSPGVVKGKITNPLGDNLKDVTIKLIDGASSTKTDDQGNYILAIPPRSTTLFAMDEEYKTKSRHITISENGKELVQDFVIDPIKPGLFYKLRLQMKNMQWHF